MFFDRVFWSAFFLATPKRNTPGFDNPRSACVPEAFCTINSFVHFIGANRFLNRLYYKL